MSENYNPILKSIRESVGMRIAVLFGSFFIFLLITSIVSLVINESPGDIRSHLLCSSVVQNLLAFCIPALLLARFSSNKIGEWLYLVKIPSIKAFWGVLLVYVVSLPAMEWLIEWNASWHLPEGMSSLEEILRRWEDASEDTTRILLEVHGLWSVLAGILVIGVLTGFSEELFFRGGFQNIMMKSSMNRYMAVWIAAFVFSAMHFQFFGFIPRLLMGAFFGYLLIWTRSIWVPVFAHVLNNSIVVISSALTGEVSSSLLEQHKDILDFSNALPIAVSIILTASIFLLFKDNLFKTKGLWQKNPLPSALEK